MKTDSFPPAPQPVAAHAPTSIGRQHVESEASLLSVTSFPSAPFVVEGFTTAEAGVSQVLSEDAATGESTQRVTLNAGWRAPIGHFNTDVEVFILSGRLQQGGFALRELSYTFIPAGLPVGPWAVDEETVLLFPGASLFKVSVKGSRVQWVQVSGSCANETQGSGRGSQAGSGSERQRGGGQR